MTANRQWTEDRHAAIIALAQARPELSYKAIGAHFGVSSSSVSQIITGKRGKRRQARLNRFLKDHTGDAEFGAIRMIIAALEPLEEPARDRVTQFALSKLRDAAKEAPTFSEARKTPIVLATPSPKPADTVDRQKGYRHSSRSGTAPAVRSSTGATPSLLQMRGGRFGGERDQEAMSHGGPREKRPSTA
jgi:hypothetical protein